MTNCTAVSQREFPHGHKLYKNSLHRDLHCLEEIGRLHDIGLVTFLHKKGVGTGFVMFSENTKYMRHPQIGHRILRSISGMEKIADAVLFHHENWDGSGYPYGLKGEEIPLLSRLVSIADAYAWASEATSPLATDTVCRKQFFEKNSDLKFDPPLMRLFIDEFLSREPVVS